MSAPDGTRDPAERPRPDALSHEQRRARRPAATARLERPLLGRRLGGVASGIAAFVGVSPTTVRALWLVSLPLSLGITSIGYVLLWLLLPPARAASGPTAIRARA